MKYSSIRLAAILTILATLLVFIPSLDNGFVNWDDGYLIDSYGWRGLSLRSIRWCFTSLVGGNYKPMVWLSYGADFFSWSLNPAGYHLTNILLHALNALLVFVLLLRLCAGKKAPWVAAGAALLFSLHPLRVESVVWISERKDVLGVFFCLLSILAYVNYARVRLPGPAWGGARRARRYYAVSLVFAALAALSKPTAVSLPFLLLVIDLFPPGGIKRPPGLLLPDKLPYFGLALLTAAMAFLSQASSHSLGPLSDIGLGQRLILAGRTWLFYLFRTVYPFNLHSLYPKDPNYAVLTLSSVLTLIGLLTVTILFFALRKKGIAWPLFAWLIYLVAWFPISGLVPVGAAWVADRFAYLPALGISLAVYCGLRGRATVQVRIFWCVALVGLSLLAIRQEGYWRDSNSLWQRTISLEPRSQFALLNLGNARLAEGETGEAIALFRRALGLYPGYPEAHNNLGNALTELGRVEEAMVSYRKALEFDPDLTEAHNNLANILAFRKDYQEAVRHYREALRIDPDYGEAGYNLGYTLDLMGEKEAAVGEYRHSIRIDPLNAPAHYRLALILLKDNQEAEAVQHLRRALAIRPDFKEARRTLDNI